MTTATATEVTTSTNNTLDAEVMELMNDLAEDNAPEVSESEVESAIEELSMEEAKQEIYESQDSAPIVNVEEAVQEQPAKSKKEKKPAAPRISTSGMKPADAIRTIAGNDVNSYMVFDTSDATLSDSELQSRVNDRFVRLDSLAKKEGSKAVNLIRHLMGKSKLEVYTHLAIKLIVEKGEISSDDLRKFYMDQNANGVKGYSQGTANSQTNQCMHVLPAFEIAKVDGKSLVLNQDSTIVEHFKTTNGS